MKQIIKKILTILTIVTIEFFLLPQNTLAMQNIDEIIIKYKVPLWYKNKTNLEVVKIKAGQDINQEIDFYNNRKNIEYAEPNYKYNQAIIPSDTYYDRQWYLQKIKATQSWNKIRESPKITIAILDSGVQIDHPDLADNIWRNIDEAPDNNIDDDRNGFVDDINGWDFINNVPDPSPKFQEGYIEAGVLHGTIIAGIAAASGNNAIGISGITWRAKIMPLKILNDEGEGHTDKVVEAIDYAIHNGADIINLSFVGFGKSISLENAIKRAHEAGIIVVAAAGNEKHEGEGYFLDSTPMYPVCHDGPKGENWIIGVAATDTLDQKALFSSYGSKCIDIAAPGVSIFSTSIYSPTNRIENRLFNEYYEGYWSGTSMAVPMVSGAIALIEASNPGLNKKEVTDILLASSDNISKLNPDYLGKLGRGRINVEAAVNKALKSLNNGEAIIITAPKTNNLSIIKQTDLNGGEKNEFLAYGDNFLGGANITSCDLDNDGNPEIITGAGFGGGPHVKIFDRDGKLKNQFFAYMKNFRGGVNVACGDLNGDNIKEIITGAGFGGGPQVRIFDKFGKIRGQFFAYDKNFRGGVNIAIGDVNGNGSDEIVTSAGLGGGPHVRIFDQKGKVQGQFFSYSKEFRGGVQITVADINGGARYNKDEIIVAPGANHEPQIKIFDNNGILLNNFLAYSKNFQGGVSVSSVDLNDDGLSDIITGAGPGGTPHVRSFKPDGTLIGSFYAYEEEFDGGINVSSLILRK